MTATDAIWTQDGSFTALEDRSLITAMFGGRLFTDLSPEVSKVDAGGAHGVVGASDLVVSAGSGHSVNVAAGQAVVRGTQTASQGAYVVGNDATLNLLISTPDATNDRIDLIQIRVSDDAAGAGVTTIDVKSGTPAGSPSAPTPDENCLVLAQVLVPASAASSANYTITDKRTRAAALGGVLVCTSSTRPTSIGEGMVIYETDTGNVLVYDGTNWTLPDNGAGGALAAPVSRTTDAGPITTEADISGLTISLPASFPGGRHVRVAFSFRGVNGSVAGDAAGLRIKEGSTVLQEMQVPIGSSLAGVGGTMEVWLTPSAGAHTYKISGVMLSGAGNFTLTAAATYPATISATDHGGT